MTPQKGAGREDPPRARVRGVFGVGNHKTLSPHRCWGESDGVAPMPLMTKHTILFTAADPSGTTRLALDREVRAI